MIVGVADPVYDPHHSAEDKSCKKEMQVERADKHQPGSHEQSPNQVRGDQELADRAGKPGEHRVRSEEKQLTVVQAAVHERVDCVDERGYCPGYETLPWRRAVRAQGGN